MFLELSEAFVCPRCRPAQGLVVLVDRIEGRRVVDGRLGCPECELRVPIEEEVVRFDRIGDAGGVLPGAGRDEDGRDEDRRAEDRADTAPGGAAPFLADADDEEAAARLAALLGADATSGYLLLGEGLERLAPGVARLCAEAEVLSLVRRPRSSETGVSWVVGAVGGGLPLFTGRMAGSALLSPGGTEAEEGIRVVRVGGRVVLLAPGTGSEDAIGASPVSEVAGQEGVLVLRREEGGFAEPFARFRGGPRPRSGGE